MSETAIRPNLHYIPTVLIPHIRRLERERMQPLIDLTHRVVDAFAIADAEAPLREARPVCRYVELNPYDFEVIADPEPKTNMMDRERIISKSRPADPLVSASSWGLAYRSLARAASPDKTSVTSWQRTSTTPLQRRNVACISLPRAPKGMAYHTVLSLPIFKAGLQQTALLGAAVHRASARIYELTKHTAVQEMLDDTLQRDVRYARSSDFATLNSPDHRRNRQAPIRMMIESLTTVAGAFTLLVGDSPYDGDLRKTASSLSRNGSIKELALKIDAGIIGPFMVRGLLPHGGLVEEVGGDIVLSKYFAEELRLHHLWRRYQLDRVIGSYAYHNCLSTEEKSLVQNDNMRFYVTPDNLAMVGSKNTRRSLQFGTDALFGYGCPAAYQVSQSEDAIDFVSNLLLRSFPTTRKQYPLKG